MTEAEIIKEAVQQMREEIWLRKEHRDSLTLPEPTGDVTDE